jgi:hypothetical protein
MPAVLKGISRQGISVTFFIPKGSQELEPQESLGNSAQKTGCQASLDCEQILRIGQLPSGRDELANLFSECQNGEPRVILGDEKSKQSNPSVLDTDGSSTVKYYCSDSAALNRHEGIRFYRDLQDSLVFVNVLATAAALEIEGSPLLELRGAHDDISAFMTRLSECKIGYCYLGKPQISHH